VDFFHIFKLVQTISKSKHILFEVFGIHLVKFRSVK